MLTKNKVNSLCIIDERNSTQNLLSGNLYITILDLFCIGYYKFEIKS
jgi:hypothetical protein